MRGRYRQRKALCQQEGVWREVRYRKFVARVKGRRFCKGRPIWIDEDSLNNKSLRFHFGYPRRANLTSRQKMQRTLEDYDQLLGKTQDPGFFSNIQADKGLIPRKGCKLIPKQPQSLQRESGMIESHRAQRRFDFALGRITHEDDPSHRGGGGGPC